VKLSKKRVAIYVSIMIGEILLIFLLSNLLGISTENTWLGAIGAAIIFATLFVMLFDIAWKVKNTRADIGCLLFFMIFTGALGMMAALVIFFSGI